MPYLLSDWYGLLTVGNCPQMLFASASGPVDGPKYGERAPHSPITESLLILATLKLKLKPQKNMRGEGSLLSAS